MRCCFQSLHLTLIYGSLVVYVMSLIKNRLKNTFASRSKPCIFIGYPMGQKGYKVYDIESHNFYITRCHFL